MVGMGAVDRVMRAYEQKHKLSEEQARIVRAEVSRFIDELLGGESCRQVSLSVASAEH